MSNQEQYSAPEGVAIIGLSGRFPGAKTTAEFWQNLVAGVEAVSFFTDEELRAEGVAEGVLADPAYVKAKAMLDDIESFDAGFFGITPKEAEITDPQQRLFLECAWAALENAGYDSEQYAGAIGLFAGSSLNSYLMVNLFSNPGLVDSVGILQTSIPNRADHLTTRCAYKLNLKGPAVTVQTACSTSLVAVHLACQSLLNYQCDMALAGGATVSVPKRSGYFHQEGGVLSPDGHCRAFDHRANGTVVGNGVGVVVLKRLADALEDGDEIHAVIRGSAINNDGSLKLGYTAPSVEGQVEVIAMAQAVAGVGPDTVTYVEAHGTGTTLGDPMEMEALTAAFRTGTDRKNYCAVGSVKTNIGHLDVAAGVAGLIKTTLALEARLLPPLTNFERPNPGINLEDSPFYFNPRPAPWETDGAPRRAGVSSFGIGGTNAHVVLEEAPPRAASGPSRPSQLLVLSAKTGAALEAATQNLSAHLRENPQASLADIAHTLAVGRRAFRHRRVLVSADAADAAQALELLTPHRVVTGLQEPKERPVVFMFTGQGSQHPGMGRELYETEATFRAEVDACAERLKPVLGLDLRDVLYPPAGQEAQAAEQLRQTFLTQPALFVTEYALAKLWMEWGVRPSAMIGHSIGEYVAACLAGVMSLPDALALVAARGRLMQGAEPGEMLSVPLPEKEVLPLLGDQLSLASVNAPGMCVVAGGSEAVGRLEESLKARDVVCRRLQTSHAFHSHMMDPILDSFRAEARRVRLSAPSIPYVSNLTGTWVTAAEATDADYWVKHLRHTVRFGEGVARLFEEPDSILLEVGPGRTLMSIARWHPAKPAGQSVFTSLPHPDEGGSAVASVQNALGRLWLAGVNVAWGGYYARERRRRVPLPTYPFERQRFWIAPQKLSAVAGDSGPLRKKENVADWFYLPVWKSSAAPPDLASAAGGKSGALWLLFVDECGLGSRLAARLEAAGQEVVTVTAGAQFTEDGGRSFTVAPGRREDFDALLKALSARGRRPTDIVHLWNVTPEFDAVSARELAAETQRRGFYSLLALAQALGEAPEAADVELTVVTNDMHRVTGDEALCPEKATVLGPCRVVPQEYKHVKGRSVDVTLPRGGAARDKLVELLAAELFSGSAEKVVAYRHNQRWTQGFEPHAIGKPARQEARLRPEGVYLITGGMGGVGLVLAEHLARTVQARLVLVGRSAFPARERWRRWLSTHDEQDAVGRKIRAVQKLESYGARVEVMSADVADGAQMKGVLAHVRERFGEVNGVIHAAGVPGGGMIQLKTPEKAAAILSPKVDGARVLGELFDGAGLDFMLLCSSRSAVLGGFGQIDYCAANAYLDAFAPYFAAKNDTFAVSVDWDGWQEVGMLVDTAARFGARDAAAAPGEETGHPLIERREGGAGEGATYVTRFGVAASWILEEHRIGGTAVLPGVTYLEMARAAFEHLSGGDAGPVELRDVFFITPMGVKDDEQRDVRLVLEKSGDGFKFTASSRAAGADAPWQDHAIGQVGRAPERPPTRHDLEEIIRRCNTREFLIGEDDERDPDLGPRWQNIKKVYLGSREMLVIFELGEEFEHDLEKLKLHPSLLDRAAGTGMLYMELEGVYLPMAYKRLRFDQPLPRRIYAYIRETENNYSKRETITFDVSIMDERGTELVEIEEFSEKRINDLTEQVRALGDKSARAAAAAAGSADAAAPGRGFYEESISEGIAPPEGVDVFTRILAGAPAAQVVVSTKDLAASIRRAESFMEEHVSAELEKLPVARTLHPRPDVQTPYAEPRNEVEQMLAQVMQEALGVDRVGVNDNFFELGGDSVLSIQIIARVARAGWQITPQQIFQHQTIAELAAVATKTGGAQPAGAEPARAAQAPEAAPAHPTFQIAELDKGQLDKLSQLLAEDDDEDEDEGGDEVEKIVYEDVGGVATAAGVAATGGAAGGATAAPAGDRNGAGEIETALRQHPSVRDAAVVAREGDDGQDGHVAYVVLKDAGAARRAAARTEFSLFYFSADNSDAGEDKYRLYLEGAKFADRNGFAAVWTPERHFHESGGLYPNPSVLSAALATATERVRLCAGSVVMPLHHSIRVAEEWSVIDNLSRGRVGLSFTAGWIPNDFAFFPERFANKREEMLRGIEEVRRLWRGQTIAARDGAGKSCELRILPRPIQPELPVWLTCSGDPQMFVKAGELGFNVLTALLSQSVEEVAAKIKLYREARARHGHDPEAGRVTLMMHTYVGDDAQAVLARVRAPLTDYLKAHVGLIETMTQSLDIKVDIDKEQYLDHLVAFAFERYYQTASLIGTPEKCLPMVKRLGEIGVNEVACFIDFGVGVGDVLEGLRHLNALRELSESAESAAAGGGEGEADELLRELGALVRDKAGDASLVLVEELPLTPRGTVDYGALPQAPAARAARTGAGASHDRE
ncbi:MAG TPA: MupA/Atu3671 family FMN-dependent luciferase-like monooxygenase [Pyrinomonadaceae bacterium]|jgi:natural product biosynthesis luciferase-like monooxygenase protein